MNLQLEAIYISNNDVTNMCIHIIIIAANFLYVCMIDNGKNWRKIIICIHAKDIHNGKIIM